MASATGFTSLGITRFIPPFNTHPTPWHHQVTSLSLDKDVFSLSLHPTPRLALDYIWSIATTRILTFFYTADGGG